MPLLIHTLVLGPLENNTYLIADAGTRQAVVIDPSFGAESVAAEANNLGYQLTAIWLTHAHFDHTVGAQAVAALFDPPLPIGLHPSDLPLWSRAGDAAMFGFAMKPGPDPQMRFIDRQQLELGASQLEVRHTPGHSPGHIIFYSQEAGAAFCGDVIFQSSVGRTDLPGGDYATLLQSIRTQILTLPPETRLLSGHGPETTVSAEMQHNPFLTV